MAEMRRRGPDRRPLVTLRDVCDANEVLMARYENQHLAQKAAEAKAKRRERKG